MERIKIAFLLIPLFLTACGNINNTTTPETEVANEYIERESASASLESESILFYGDYVLEGSSPDTLYYNRIIFFPDGKCYVHYINTNETDREIDRGYYTYEYSFSSDSNKVGIGSTSGGTGNILEIPIMSENRTLLKFENYALKRVDEQ